MFLSRSPLFKTPKQVFFNPIHILTLLPHSSLTYYYKFTFFISTSIFSIFITGYLRDSGQEETAAELKAQEGDYVTAINLYLKGGYPARAASIVKQHDVRSGGQQLQERIANELTRAGMHERAGEFYELLGKYSKATL